MEFRHEQSVPLPCGWKLNQGRYTVTKVLGMGGFGITYQAQDQGFQKQVAVKELYPRGYVKRNARNGTILPQAGKSQDFEYLRKRFREEAEVIYSFRETPEILNVYGLFDENGTSYYVMELLEGESLQKVIDREGKCSWAYLRKIAWPLLDSIQILHDRNLIHRDISPDNIFIQKNGDVKLIDFGSVRNYAEADHFTTILKEHFAPPEQAVNKSTQGPQTDIYALSATFYYALSKTLPVRSAQRGIDRAQGRGESLIPLRLLEPSLPDFVTEAIEKGMQMEIGSRFSSARLMREALFPGRSSSGEAQLRWLVCVRGIRKGGLWPFRENQILQVGREEGCAVKYGPETAGISRHHCSFFCREGGIVYVMDNRSTYGTYLNGRQILPGRWYPVSGQDRILVGTEEFSVR